MGVIYLLIYRKIIQVYKDRKKNNGKTKKTPISPVTDIFRSLRVTKKVHSFIFQNTEYRSIKECCKKLSLSYSKVRRLTRHYKRAQNDPSVAISWALGLERISVNEPKTFLYQDDLIKAYDRQLKFKDKVRNIFMNEF